MIQVLSPTLQRLGDDRTRTVHEVYKTNRHQLEPPVGHLRGQAGRSGELLVEYNIFMDEDGKFDAELFQSAIFVFFCSTPPICFLLISLDPTNYCSLFLCC